MCSIICWIFSIWEALGWKFCIFGLIHALPTRGEVWAWNDLPDAFRRFSGGFEPFLGSVGHRSDRSRSPVWPVWVLVLCTCWAPVWPVLMTGLTGVSCSGCSCPVFKWFACIRPGGGALFQGEIACVQGELFVVIRALFRWFALFAWVLLCLGCVEPLPLPKGSETCLLQVILLFAFVWLSIACWSFFLFDTSCGCCQCTHQGEIEDHVWFDDRWMVASLCDEWLTTLCGRILG
jgi:hypothetical protein